MRIFRKMKSVLRGDWCRECQSQMETTGKRLYMLPVTVGHYVSHKDAEYYRKNLIPVSKKAEIPAGFYACGITGYRCPECGYRRTKLSVFLPVRDEEKYEEFVFFECGEMDGFV